MILTLWLLFHLLAMLSCFVNLDKQVGTQGEHPSSDTADQLLAAPDYGPQ